MNFHRANQPVEIRIPHLDIAGQSFTPVSINVGIYDAAENLVLEVTDLPVGADGVSLLTVPAEMNALGDAETRGVRVIRATLRRMGDLPVYFTHYYGLEGEQTLRLFANSFQTYPQALLTAVDFVNVTAFMGAAPERQVAALIEAHMKISQMPLICALPDSAYRVASTTYLNPEVWETMTPDTFATLPQPFRRAILAAQVLEANELIEGNVIGRKHAQGIASETIGESSVTLRPGFNYSGHGGISHAAQAVLSPYIDTAIRLGRG